MQNIYASAQQAFAMCSADEYIPCLENYQDSEIK